MTKMEGEKVLKRNYCLWMDAGIRERVDKVSARSPYTVSRIVEECVLAYLPVFENYVRLLDEQKRRAAVETELRGDSLGVVKMSSALDAMLLNPTYVGAAIASMLRDLHDEHHPLERSRENERKSYETGSREAAESQREDD